MPVAFRRDIAHSARSLARSPAVAVPAIVALALGIGLTSAMFSVVYDVLIKGMPFREGDRIAMVSQTDPAAPADQQDAMSLAQFDAYHARQRAFELFGADYIGNSNVNGGDRPDRLETVRITPDAMEVTGVRPLLGRPLQTSDDVADAPLVALIGYQTWVDRWCSRSSATRSEARSSPCFTPCWSLSVWCCSWRARMSRICCCIARRIE